MPRNPLTNLRLYVSSTVDFNSATETTSVGFGGTYFQCWRQLRQLFGLPRYGVAGQTAEQISLQNELTAFLNGRTWKPLVHPVYGRFSCVETRKN